MILPTLLLSLFAMLTFQCILQLKGSNYVLLYKIPKYRDFFFFCKIGKTNVSVYNALIFMKHNNFSEAESLELITSMIQDSRARLARNSGTPFLIWGYTTVAISILNYILSIRYQKKIKNARVLHFDIIFIY